MDMVGPTETSGFRFATKCWDVGEGNVQAAAFLALCVAAGELRGFGLV
jgi:hypothetical protein